MPIILDRSPFAEHPSEVAFLTERVSIRADQIIIWLTLSLKRVTSPNPSVVPFPVILDTGHSHTFSLHERHLIEWAGLRPEVLTILGAVRERGQRILLREVNLWAHPTAKGSRDQLADRPAHQLAAPRGIAVYPGAEFPRLPILGLRVIAENELVLKVDGKRRKVTLRTPRRWWPFS